MSTAKLSRSAAASAAVVKAIASLVAGAVAGRLLVGHPFHLLSGWQPAPAVAHAAAPDRAAAEVLVERLQLVGQRPELHDASAGVGQLVGDSRAKPGQV